MFMDRFVGKVSVVVWVALELGLILGLLLGLDYCRNRYRYTARDSVWDWVMVGSRSIDRDRFRFRFRFRVGVKV
jgi:hypothetical protein